MAIHGGDPVERPENNAPTDALLAEKTKNDTLMNLLQVQTGIIANLTETVKKLSTSPPSVPEPTNLSQQPLRFLYRTWHSNSRAKEDESGDIVAGNPDWLVETEDEIALHFAEFHSDKTSKKDTTLISVTHDPVRAIKVAYYEWKYQSFDTRDASTIFISTIKSSGSYSAKALKERALAKPTSLRLSKEAYNRLTEPRNLRLYDSEHLFVSRISKEQIKVRVSLQDLFDKKLLDDILPELDERHDVFDSCLSPSAIRSSIFRKYDGAVDKVAGRLEQVYCALAGLETKRPKRSSLRLAQQLMQDDPTLDDCVREIGIDMIQKKMGRLRVRAVPVR
ncbi:hypothetical protein C7974DRAFT_405386 [Boeremia exigua]|uniref:uncharacterized protein n=1 Tax=Boeremia exigua TaxID=749465 RepID=UPI001E8E854C|nr:uncharacterized protein C7974DRAFT_405386 [Boeremia exigua]KAH6613213.1 hypothetical protein C7974DRAFT_405386 [Boeremia exigua]